MIFSKAVGIILIVTTISAFLAPFMTSSINLQADFGYEALRISLKHEFDLILLDARMPGMDGYQVCARSKEDARTRDIKEHGIA